VTGILEGTADCLPLPGGRLAVAVPHSARRHGSAF